MYKFASRKTILFHILLIKYRLYRQMVILSYLNTYIFEITKIIPFCIQHILVFECDCVFARQKFTSIEMTYSFAILYWISIMGHKGMVANFTAFLNYSFTQSTHLSKSMAYISQCFQCHFRAVHIIRCFFFTQAVELSWNYFLICF